ncbi:TOTE conflict system archaeo-eukaryotic primase domain-containing protein [Micromonospora sp. RTP1Z1]|uniref:TOTE conflict system archaeo-eukaryotic primase domain-containing protein n=1 Tax=Micromonospora sp. RTP1Z1 TaxID=2994043 RepID=UPI0029C83923|nr:DEAD/DEAH box helicase family protein [Micromonospora sp. RTP1Z1]
MALIRAELAALRAEVARLTSGGREVPAQEQLLPGASAGTGTRERLVAERVALFRSLFVGRDDVYAQRWEKDGRKGWYPQLERLPGQTWQEAKDARRYRPLTDAVLHDHLAGKISAGLYPMLADDTCRLLACDFDGAQWQLDAQAYVQAAGAVGVPTAVEVSRSGQGAHVWTFFSEPVPAVEARALGFGLLREAMAVRGELGLDSYDRFFPSQDHLPAKGEGLGNLIALPLQKQCRDAGTTVFVDPETFTPYPDQWAYLAGVAKLGLAGTQRLVVDLRPVAVGPEASLFRSALRPDAAPPVVVHAEWAGMLAVRRAGLPLALLASLKHAASLANPEFYKNENLRLSNWNTPRYIRCYTEDLEFLYLPRAMVDKAAELVAQAGSRLEIDDRRADPPGIEVAFTATLRDRQPDAVAELTRYEHGVLEAPPGFGKTVMGCALIAHHKTPTLVLVDRAPLMDQWRERLTTVLDIDSKRIGQIGGGKTKPTGVIDLAMMQTVARMDDAAERLSGYGLVIVDEAHHAGAPTVEKALRRIPARRWIGLTATAYRRDGLGPIIFMHCGPKRHSIPMVDKSDPEALHRSLHVHQTAFALPADADTAKPGAITSVVFGGLVADDTRNDHVCHDVHTALDRGRNCLVLTRQTAHVEALAQRLRDLGHEPHLLYATRKTKDLKQVLAFLADPPADGPPLLVIATDKYVGEGYDCPKLDTLFLAHPVSFRGSMVQYVGRILRTHPGKTSVEVHDYVDERVGVLAAMWRKRSRSYTQLGFALTGISGR